MTLPKLRNILLVDTFVLLTIYVIMLAASSLQWRMLHDSPIVMYISLMIDKFGYVPYRDLLDVNLPGTYLIYALVGRISSYSDLGFRIADLIYLAAIAALTWVWMRDFGKKVAWASALFGVMLYLSYGQVMSFQREFLILLPLMGALVTAVRFPERRFMSKYFIIGLLFGLAATIKPQAALGMPFLIAFQAWDLWRGEGLERKRFLLMGVMTAVGFVIPIGMAIFYLWQAGALPSFIEMAQNWWPLNLYITTITTDLQIVTGPVFREYLWSGYITGIFTLWLIPMFVGVWLALTS
ncbi:MAG: glycosyltransferase family 39 protein [Anaerolineales bacterium]|nr:glycosyltransferase family 39 protein [Anaerolineales bacterium]